MAGKEDSKRAGAASSSALAHSSRLEHQLAAAQELTHIGSWEWDLASGRVHWSDELYRIYGLEPQCCVMTFESFVAKIHPEDRERVQHDVHRALEAGGRFAHSERILRPDGSVRELDSVGEVIRDASGKTIGLIGTCRDVTDERTRDASIQIHAYIVRSVQIGLSVWRPSTEREGDLTLVAFNPATERIAGLALEESVGRSMLEMFPGLAATELPETLSRVAADGQQRELPSLRLPTGTDGQLRTFAAKVFTLPSGCVGLALEDITEQARARKLQAAERRVLELVAAGEDLPEIASELIRAIEKHAPRAIASIQLVDADGKRIRHLAAPSLPHAYNLAVDGLPTGPEAGSCGTAVYLDRAVFVSDISTDPLWRRYRETALSYGLRACWSTPIHSSQGRILGTFALYYREPRKPTSDEVELIARATHVAGIALERKQLDDQLRALSAHIEAAREDERTAMAREIHDELGQSLTALKMDVAWLQRRCDTAELIDKAPVSERLKLMSAMIDGVIDQVRRIAAELRPGVLDDLGLGAAIEWQAQDFSRRFGILCHVESDVQEHRFARRVSTAIFRTLQEALTNVARHAHATSVAVTLQQKDGRLRLQVVDDGVGISPAALSRPGCLGLVGMRERARQLGGSARFSARPGGGTRVSVDVPLEGAS